MGFVVQLTTQSSCGKPANCGTRHNQRLQLSVNGQPTTYLLDYARGGGRVLQETSALETKFYLYGDTCLAELVETDDPEQPEQRYYLYDGSQTVRQTVNEQAEPTYAWTFSPEGAVLLGEEGPVSHLSCVGDAVYDWSTGLIYKNGRYYDPRSDLWLTFGSPAVVWAAHRLGGKPDKRRNKKQDKRFFWLLFLLLVLFVLVSCDPPPSTSTPELPTATAAATATKCPTDTPTPTSVPPTPTNAPTNTPTITPSPTNTPRPTQTFTPTHTATPQHPYKLLPLTPPDGLKIDGPLAWIGLNQIQQKQGFWGNELDEREALLLIINHELAHRVQWQIAQDVIINQYKNACNGGTWSASCINHFWGYSSQIKGNEVYDDGSLRGSDIVAAVANLTDSLLNGTAVAQDTTLIHYGNALVDSSAQKLYQDYLNGNTKYATYVVPTYCANGPGKNPPDCKENPDGITGVWALQTYEQNRLTGTLQDWVYPTPTP